MRVFFLILFPTLTNSGASVSRMAFVGLTDAYNASVCLLYHMYEGEMKEWMFATHARKAEDTLAKEGAVMADRLGGLRVDRDYWFGTGRFKKLCRLIIPPLFPTGASCNRKTTPTTGRCTVWPSASFLHACKSIGCGIPIRACCNDL